MYVAPLSFFNNSISAPKANKAPSLLLNNNFSSSFGLNEDTFSFTGKRKGKKRKSEEDDDYFINKVVKTPNMGKILNLPKTKKFERARPKSFEEGDKKLTLDPYQKEAVESFKEGNTTIVTAPTGMGKTLITEYAIDDALKNNKKIIYLSPLKALSNEKFVKFSELFGEYDKEGNLVNSDNIGLITGDTIIHPNANLLVMTTEIYRNALFSDEQNELKAALKDVTGVIYDEFHYLGDKDRGTVWEEAVTETPKHIKQMMLSATASNANEVGEWIQFLNPDIKTKLINVPESERHVPLQHFVFGYNKYGTPSIIPTQKQKITIDKALKEAKTSNRKREAFKELKKFFNLTSSDNMKDLLYMLSSGNDVLNTEVLEAKLINMGMEKERAKSISLVLSDPKLLTYVSKPKLSFGSEDDMTFLIETLQEKEMTPALVYIFSKQGCENAFRDAVNYNGTLLSSKESRKVLDYINEAKEKGIYLGEDFDKKYLKGLLSGYAVHHAGMLPAYKSLVENLAREGLVKVCFATETLIAGIDMPFKTSVFTSFEKPTKKSRHTPITSSLFIQGAGRAGRRGKDLVGNVIVMPKSLDQYQDYYLEIAKKPNTKIESGFSLSYNSLLQDKYFNSLESALEKTFAAKRTANSVNSLKKESLKMLGYLCDKGLIDSNETGKTYITEKGQAAKKIRGINEVFMSELVCNPIYTQKLNSEDLIALATTFADIQDDSPAVQIRNSKFQELNRKIAPAIKLADTINKEQSDLGIEKPINFSTNLVPSIYKFATSSPNKSIEVWNKTMKEMKYSEIIKYEGDYLRVVNGTIDLLRTMKNATPDENLKQKADKAIEMLQKPPVTDILSYELKF